jgi:hypothetical protein
VRISQGSPDLRQMAPKVVDRKGTHLVHGDAALHRGHEVAPAISVTTSTYDQGEGAQIIYYSLHSLAFLSRLPNDEETVTDQRVKSRSFSVSIPVSVCLQESISTRLQ